jgi:hypothetical protein
MSKKIVRYVYQGKEYIEECDKAAERVFKDRSEDELVRFNSLKKHSPKGQKRYLAGDPKNLYPLGVENKNLIRQIKQIRPGWFMPPHIGRRCGSVDPWHRSFYR